MNLDERIRTFRRAAKMSKLALAQSAQLDWKAVHQIERGERVPTLPTIRRLAAALGVEVSDLVD